ncbi:hypothetical protein SETIT_1G336600v2 [Setaria italica]|uniref:WRC domain-containing protein n=2 Tax=Setaria TaxID=4554 RepID=K3YZM3_SETIT|nr:uncharacterized protein LOC101764230 [Setaria italica]RCV08565.1 hypothetical protein SETIT_1G336600v2 [Setaria italica]
MRIRRRPPGQPLGYLLPSDPPAAPRPSPAASVDHQERPAADKREEAGLHLHPFAAADLGEGHSSPARCPALLPLLPKDSVVERGRVLGAQQQVPADGRRSLENGHHHVPEPVIKAGVHLSNGGAGAAVSATTTTTTIGANATKPQVMKDDGGGGGSKKTRGPGVLLEGSRCSRKNGRGWRCSQPTMVGYALCQYHLGKGRMRSAAAAAAGKLGRTENGKRASAAPSPAAAAPPKADMPPPSVQHC